MILSQLAIKPVGCQVSLAAEAVWQPMLLATKSVGSQVGWLPSQLAAKSFTFEKLMNIIRLAFIKN
jgi:hypothetical protein